MSILGRKLLALHDSLDSAGLPHAFGGAIALAYCTHDPRGTSDVDVYVFVGADRADAVRAALPDGVECSATSARELMAQGQVRVWWAETPVDLFLNVADFHGAVAARADWVPFEGRQIPVLSCRALAVFKAMFDRPKDWVDLQETVAAGSLDVPLLRADLAGILGIDPRLAKVQDLRAEE